MKFILYLPFPSAFPASNTTIPPSPSKTLRGTQDPGEVVPEAVTLSPAEAVDLLKDRVIELSAIAAGTDIINSNTIWSNISILRFILITHSFLVCD